MSGEGFFFFSNDVSGIFDASAPPFTPHVLFFFAVDFNQAVVDHVKAQVNKKRHFPKLGWNPHATTLQAEMHK